MSSTRTADTVVAIIYKGVSSITDLYNLLTSNSKSFAYDVNAATVRSSSTALHAACANPNAEVVRVLLEMGANPNQKDSDDKTPLFAALEAGSVECVKLLIEHGARLDMQHDHYYKDTYLRYALDWCKSEEIKIYIRSQLDSLNLHIPEDFTFISHTDLTQAMKDFSSALKIRDFKTASDLCDKFPIDVNLQGIFANYYTEHYMPAITSGDLDMVRFFVERGSYVTGDGDMYNKVLFPDIARKAGQEQVAAYLESVQQQRYDTLKAELARSQKSVSSPTLFKPAVASLPSTETNAESTCGEAATGTGCRA